MKLNEDKLTNVLTHVFCVSEAETIVSMLVDDEEREENYTSEDICNYIDWCKNRHKQKLSTDFKEWVESRKVRVHIRFMVSESGYAVSGELDFPKRGEDMEFGSEYEWYYSLREVTDEIMRLPVGGSMNFKIRDDKNSHGVVIRTA